MSILIITRSDDNESVELVAEAVARKGGHTIRFDTDRYPTEVRLTLTTAHPAQGTMNVLR